MRNKSLFRKSMLLVMTPVLIVSIIIVFFTQLGIKQYFEKESFQTLNNEISRFQELNENLLDNMKDFNGPKILELNARIKNPKNLRGIIIVETMNGEYKAPNEASFLINLEKDNIKTNNDWPLEGKASINSENVFYAITPIDNSVYKNANLFSEYRNLYYLVYISESYSKDLANNVMLVFLIGLSALILILASINFIVFRKISVRLKILEEGTVKMGRGEFDNEIPFEPFDEIGRLGKSMNLMAKKLGISQKEQAENFQMISHELKTPIMVIQGYMEALAKNQYPKGTREGTLEVVTTELDKLETLTNDILILNKSEYLARNNAQLSDIEIRQLFEEVINRLGGNQFIKFTIKGDHKLVGDKKSWLRVIENIISNQLRYAKSEITINLGKEISVINDGEQISEGLIDKIKIPFIKGESGRSGLGLAIIENIVKIYGYVFEIRNVKEGVEYLLMKDKSI